MKLFFACSLVLAIPAGAQQLHVCKGANGETVYQDRPCGAPISITSAKPLKPDSPLPDAAKEGILQAPGLLTEALGRTFSDAVSATNTRP